MRDRAGHRWQWPWATGDWNRRSRRRTTARQPASHSYRWTRAQGDRYVPPRGETIGRPAGSLLEDNPFTRRIDPRVREYAIKGEMLTSGVLDHLAMQPGGPTILHSLRFPKANITSNIDHVLLAGSRVLVIDSKCLRPGVYSGDAEMTLRRDGVPVDGALRTRTAVLAPKILRGYSGSHHHRPSLALPLLVLWPSSPAAIHHRHLRLPEVRITTGQDLSTFVRANHLFAPADPALVESLRRLVL